MPSAPSMDPNLFSEVAAAQMAEIELMLLDDYVFIVQRVPTPTEELPLVTCHSPLCPTGIIEAGEYRVSLEKWERLHPPYNYIEPAAVQPLHVALLAPKEIESYVRGVGHGRQWWFCLACVEEMAERALAQKLQTAGVEGKLAVNSLAWFASRIMPECRIPFGLPGYFCLTSPERYALNLWVAHQLYLYYRCRGRLNVLTANFEEPLTTTFVGREGQTIYLSQDTRDSRGRLDNDTLAEITLSEVKNCSLTQALRKATVLILRLRKHQDTQQRQTRPVQHPSTLPTFNLADRLAAESLLALSRGAEMGRRPLSPLSSSSSTIEAEAIDTKPDLNLVPDWVFTQEHAPRTRVVSRSTNSLVIAFPNIPRSPPQRRSRPPSALHAVKASCLSSPLALEEQMRTGAKVRERDNEGPVIVRQSVKVTMIDRQRDKENHKNSLVGVLVPAAEVPECLLPLLGLTVHLNGVERVADFRNVGVIG